MQFLQPPVFSLALYLVQLLLSQNLILAPRSCLYQDLWAQLC